MEELTAAVLTALTTLEWRSIIDILVVGLIVYWLLTLIQGTTAIASATSVMPIAARCRVP